MQGHESYEELCALNAIGQLSTEELEELQAHVAACPVCKNAGEDYAVILDLLPAVVDTPLCSTAAIVRQARREQFMRYAQSRGVQFSKESVGAEPGCRPSPKKHTISFKTSFAIAASICLAGLFFHRFETRQNGDGRSHQIASPAVKQQVTEPVSVVSPNPRVDSLQDVAARQVVNLRKEVIRLETEFGQANAALELLRSRYSELSQKSETNAQALREAKEQLAASQAAQSEMAAVLVEKQDKIRDLSSEISGQKLAAEQERELTAAASDVRELMAARSLHIIDVADVDGRGKARKSFGRVFYVEGQSLLFYAFDLGEISSPSKVLFQAWGQQEGAGGRPKNLGIFRVDDQSQRRWVLRVNDPHLLASIDSLFVTVEPSPGADQPSGHRLIYAYLGTPANHP